MKRDDRGAIRDYYDEVGDRERSRLLNVCDTSRFADGELDVVVA